MLAFRHWNTAPHSIIVAIDMLNYRYHPSRRPFCAKLVVCRTSRPAESDQLIRPTGGCCSKLGWPFLKISSNYIFICITSRHFSRRCIFTPPPWPKGEATELYERILSLRRRELFLQSPPRQKVIVIHSSLPCLFFFFFFKKIPSSFFFYIYFFCVCCREDGGTVWLYLVPPLRPSADWREVAALPFRQPVV